MHGLFLWGCMLLLLLLQAGILQGQVDSLMVMDQWQASLMRALAQLQLKSSPEVRQRVEEQFDMEDDPAQSRAAADNSFAGPSDVANSVGHSAHAST